MTSSLLGLSRHFLLLERRRAHVPGCRHDRGPDLCTVLHAPRLGMPCARENKLCWDTGHTTAEKII